MHEQRRLTSKGWWYSTGCTQRIAYHTCAAHLQCICRRGGAPQAHVAPIFLYRCHRAELHACSCSVLRSTHSQWGSALCCVAHTHSVAPCTAMHLQGAMHLHCSVGLPTLIPSVQCALSSQGGKTWGLPGNTLGVHAQRQNQKVFRRCLDRRKSKSTATSDNYAHLCNTQHMTSFLQAMQRL
jgi:hypothetical protein